jgi:hypothetical protein
LIIVTLIAAALVNAAAPSKLAAAIETYEVGRFQDAVDQLAGLVDDPRLTAAERATACVYSGAALLELGRPDLARAQLMLAAKTDPNVRANPSTFVPQLVSMLDEERAKLAQQRPAPVEKREEQPPPPVETHATPEADETSSGFPLWLLPGGAGLVVAGLGTYLLVVANQQWQLLNTMRTPEASLADADSSRRDGPRNLYLGIGAVALGAVGIIASVVLLARDSPPVAIVPLTSGGAAVTLQGAF